MYQDRIFEEAKREASEANLSELKSEVKTVESVIEKFLTQMLECTTSFAERDYHMMAV